MIPFTAEQFLSVFARYNVADWPVQIFLYVIGLSVFYFAFQQRAELSKTVASILFLFWV